MVWIETDQSDINMVWNDLKGNEKSERNYEMPAHGPQKEWVGETDLTSMVELLRRSYLSKRRRRGKRNGFLLRFSFPALLLSCIPVLKSTTFPPLLYGFQLVEGRLSSAPDVLLHFDPRVGRCGDHQAIPFAVPALKVWPFHEMQQLDF